MSKVFHRFVLSLAISVLACAVAGASAADVQDVRLYTLDCGHVSPRDTGFLSNIGDLDGKPGEFANPCYLIGHPKGWLLWDTGLGDALAARKGVVDTGDGRVIVPVTLVSQLQAIGVTPDQITYVAFSHHHVDRLGNAGLFTTATWLLNKAELASSAPGWERPFRSPPTRQLTPAWSTRILTSLPTALSNGRWCVFGTAKVPQYAPPAKIRLRARQAGAALHSSNGLSRLSDALGSTVFV